MNPANLSVIRGWDTAYSLIQGICELQGVGGTFILGSSYKDMTMEMVGSVNPVATSIPDQTGAVARLKVWDLNHGDGWATPQLRKDLGYTYATEYPGALATLGDDTHTFFAAFSGAPGAHDCVYAALALMSFTFDIELHHVGERLATQESYQVAVEQMRLDHLKVAKADTPLGSDHHLRTYAGVFAGDLLIGLLEVQYFPQEEMPHKSMSHIDVAVHQSDILQFLGELEAMLRQVPDLDVVMEVWPDTGSGPVGMVMVNDFNEKRDHSLAVHVRPMSRLGWLPDGIPAAISN